MNDRMRAAPTGCRHPWAVVRARAIAAACTLLAAVVLAGCVSTGGERPAVNESDAAAVNVQLGLNYLRDNELALAQTKLERALSEDPHSADVHGALALLDERLGDSQQADREYHRALALSHRSPQMLNNYAVYLCSHDRAVEGVRYFEEAATDPLYPTPWAAYTNAGVCLHQVHRDAEAMQRFTRALQLRPSFVDATYQAAGLEFAQQHYVAARLRIELYLMSNQGNPALLLLGWQIARAQGDAAGQQRYADRLVREFPDSSQAHALENAVGRSGSG